MKKKTTLLIADDHPLLRRGLIEIVRNELDLRNILETSNGREAFELLKKNEITIAILDISMPGMNGLEIIERVVRSGIDTQCVILTLHKEQSYFNRAMDAGAKGYLLKDFAESEVTSCIQEVYNGNMWVSEAMKKILKTNEKNELLGNLTKTEAKIIQLIAQSKSSKEISELLFVSDKTIENHRSNICKKLALPSKPNSLVSWVLEHKSNLMGNS